MRDGRDAPARRREARALRDLLARLPGHLGLVVLAGDARPLPLGTLRRWRIVDARPDLRAPRLAYPPAAFDAVVLVHVLGDGPAARALLAESLRVLADPGRLVILQRHPLAPVRTGGPRFVPLGRLLRRQGLRIDRESLLFLSPFPALPTLRIVPLDRLVVARRPRPAGGLRIPAALAPRLRGSVPHGSRFHT